MIVSSALQEKEMELYYAPKLHDDVLDQTSKDNEKLLNNTVFYPGFFKGDIVKTSIVSDNDMLDHHVKTAVHWKNLRNTDQQPDPSCLGVSCSGHGICFEGNCICMHGWNGAKCDVNPCENHITTVPSDKYCGQCKVTFKLNPSTIYPHHVSSVMVAGSFSNWSAIELTLDDYNEDTEDYGYSQLYPEDSFYHGMSSSRSYSVDLHIPHGQNHTYKFILDHALWTFDKCNPNAVSDGLETMDLNSLLHVSCPSSGGSISTTSTNSKTCQEFPESVIQRDEKQSKEQDDYNKEDKDEINHSEMNSVDSGSVIQLFEWTFSSVAKECKRLGEEGWVAVQLSPVNAHLVLAPDNIDNFNIGESVLDRPIYPWWQRYQPASYEIKSRSGTEAELRAATMECARHGIQIWVELGMNSMNAAPCCDIPGPLDYPTCDGFFSDNSKSCAPERIFPSAGFDTGDLHSPPCGIGAPGTWGSPDVSIFLCNNR